MGQREGGGRSGSGGGGGPAPFLVKTHQMVEDGGTDEVISWGEKGRSFVVWKPAEFARDLLPVHFKHNNFSSFVRQLNTYGFRKVVPDKWEFANEKFRQGEQGLLTEIRRRKASLPQSQQISKQCNAGRVSSLPPLPPIPPSAPNSYETHSSSSASTSSPPPLPSRDLLKLSNENKKLRKEKQTLTEEIAQTKRQCEELLGFLSRFLDVSRLDLQLLMREDVSLLALEEKLGSRVVGIGDEGKEEGCVKLFGVLLKSFESEESRKEGGRKRGRCEEGKDVKVAPWIPLSTPVQQRTSKVFMSLSSLGC